MMKKIALIPARGGSKRIPHKNIKHFCGKPIIAYPIATALESTLFDEVVVSTDSQEIAIIARNYGANVPFMRPKELSDDFTPTTSVATHAANMLNLHDDDLLCVITPLHHFCAHKRSLMPCSLYLQILQNTLVSVLLPMIITPIEAFISKMVI